MHLFAVISLLLLAFLCCTTASGYKGVILFCPGGRKETMELQVKYVLKLLEYYDGFIARYDIWDVAWKEEDSNYLRTLPQLHPKIRILYTPFMEGGKRGGEIASKQFAFIYSTFYRHDIYKDYIFVKLDDDIVFIDVLMFPQFILNRIQSSAFLLSANVINNDVSLFYEIDRIHRGFLSKYGEVVTRNRRHNEGLIPHSPQKYLSINFVSFLGSALLYINHEFSNGIGMHDEYKLTAMIPTRIEVNASHAIDPRFTVVHYSYGGDSVNYYGKQYFFIPSYHALAGEYLTDFDNKVKSLGDLCREVLKYFEQPVNDESTASTAQSPQRVTLVEVQ
jgi:hypothetical protein